MLWKTHLAFGFFIGLIFVNFYIPSNKYLFFTVLLVASILPDIDHTKSKISSKIPLIPTLLSFFVKHRGIIHSLPFLTLLVYLVNMFFGKEIAIAVLVGYLSHLVADGLTKAGVNFLHPFGQLKLQGFIETGSFMELVVFLILLIGIVVKYFEVW